MSDLAPMIDDADLNRWFCREVLPLEGSLTHFIRRNLRDTASVGDVRQEVYARVLAGCRKELPIMPRPMSMRPRAII